jgi:3-oxoacyl-[acyl-carrier-protein] synthase II
VNHRRRVVITGLGVVAPNGIGKDAFWRALLTGKSAIDLITSFDASKYPSRVAGEIRNFRPTDYMPARIANSAGRFTHLAVAASVLAVRDARLPEDLGTMHPRSVLCFGTSAGGIADIGEHNLRRFISAHPFSPDRMAILEFSSHAASSHISRALSLTGSATTLASGCASGLDVVASGCLQIAAGKGDIAIVGASEVPLSEFIFSLFAAGGFLSTWSGPPSASSRPYDRLRSGLVLAEAAGAIVIEELEHAQHRGAPIYAELAGYGCASEGGLNGSRRTVYTQGLALAINAACQAAHIPPSRIDYVNAHGNSTLDDDPECDLDYVPKTARSARIRTALVHAHSLGGRVPGTHTALILFHPSAVCSQ